MSEWENTEPPTEGGLRLSDEQLRLVEATTGVGAFEFDTRANTWVTTPQMAELFGLDPRNPHRLAKEWEAVIFPDDLLKMHAAFEGALKSRGFNVEIRVRHPDGSLHWLAGTGRSVQEHILRGTWHDISERKRLESRLLALNETLEARVAQAQEEARALEILNNTGVALAAELDLERLVQIVTDAGVELTQAQFGAFFYNVIDKDGESYTLYTLSGVSREAFAAFPMPRNTAIFEPTFRGLGTVRSGDILKDSRYGQNPPYHGMPKGHLPVRSYLAVPVVSRSGEVIGGLFFGHGDPGQFSERDERIITGVAAQAAVAIDNARLYQKSQQEIEARARTEENLQFLNETLEQRVTERTQQLEDGLRQLRESESRFRLLVEAVSDYAIYMLDPQGFVVKWNPGAERLKGYTAAEIVGQHFSRFYTDDDRAGALPGRTIAAATQANKFETEGWRVRKDGSTFWASVVIEAIRDHEGELLGFAKVTRDLTNKRAAEEQLRQAQKMEAIGQLTGGVAHDFNNLLTIISGNLDILQRRLVERGDSQLLRYVTFAMNGAMRGAALTHQLLAFSRRQPLDPKAVSVNNLITTMSEMIRRTLPENISVETVLSGGVWATFIDPNQLENSLLNLAVNARDAMPEGGKLTIEAANVYLDDNYAANAGIPSGQYVGIFVSDTGVGMTPDVLSQAFDPFFTTKDIGQGTGLGLSQVYGFVKQSGGHVRIYSEYGAGTTVRLYLPRLLTSESLADLQQSSQAVIPRAEGESVLVVEDEKDVRTFVVEMLRELGYRVVDAPDGNLGLRLLEINPDIALLFTDVGLPGGMNGRQLADEAVRRRPALKVLFTSGYARNAIVHHGRLDPGVQLITKPFAVVDLAAKVRQILDSPSGSKRRV
jgi:PAS domain S-box-containing protein